MLNENGFKKNKFYEKIKFKNEKYCCKYKNINSYILYKNDNNHKYL